MSNPVLLQNLKRIKRVLLGTLENLANAQIQGIPIFWLVGVWGSYALVGLYQAGGEVIILQSGDSDAQEIIWLTRILWVLVLTGLGLVLGAGTQKGDSIVASVVVAITWTWVLALTWAGGGAVGWGLGWAGTWALPGAGAWALMSILAGAGAWFGAGALAWFKEGVLSWSLGRAWAGAYFGTQLWISIVSYLWAIGQPKNDIRWRSWLMAILSFLLGSFCFYQANQQGEDIRLGVILGAAVMGIIALVVATLVGAGKRLWGAGFGYWARWFWLAVPAVLGVVAGWRSYGVFPWAG